MLRVKPYQGRPSSCFLRCPSESTLQVNPCCSISSRADARGVRIGTQCKTWSLVTGRPHPTSATSTRNNKTRINAAAQRPVQPRRASGSEPRSGTEAAPRRWLGHRLFTGCQPATTADGASSNFNLILGHGRRTKFFSRSAGLHPSRICTPQTVGQTDGVENPAPSRLQIGDTADLEICATNICPAHLRHCARAGA